MSCDTLNSSAIQLNVSVASLPEGFCPATIQEMANVIGSRFIISPSADFNTFAIGSTAPASNVGPWLKDCLEWFVFDDATATYIPENSVSSGGFKSMEYHTTSGTFTVPDFIFKLRVQLWGGGAGGSTSSAGLAKGGSGAGGYVLSILDVTPGQMIPYTIGAGGAAGSPGAAGGTSTFSTLTAGGGAAGATTIYPTAGGTAAGGTVNIPGQAGGPGDAGSGTGGTGGSSSNGGGGGNNVSPANASIQNGVVPGGGGSGAYDAGTAGSGAGGAVLIEY